MPPSFMWFLAERNIDVRVVAWQTRFVLACDEAVRSSGKSFLVRCTIDDIGMRAARYPGDKGDLQALLDEVDDNLTGAVVQMQFRPDGRMVNFDLEEYDRARNRRTARMQENLRLVLARAVAGFDLQLPKKGYAEMGVWAQYESMLMLAPTSVGSAGSSELAHKVQLRDAHLVSIDTMGRGIIAPAAGDGPQNLYDTRIEGVTAFDLQNGHMLQRVWTALGDPTAGSMVSEAGAGIPYAQRGMLKLLVEGEPRPDVGPSLEVNAPGRTPTTLQAWTPIGLAAPTP